ncbi:TPA: hypothetical protein SL854_003169 [Pseudomonas aeruginosa]|nr:hypothetical protein [Pseudomonas aeruginosa]MBH4119785.1 hypothetical protein [Pseudomonas aeruginosa]MBH9137099.1 hypothetical protein [Pseudomonas aeruginosa]MBH9338536.1 hypothetical protein [Pseudomonas aeruginosa]HEJ6446086.1 hypothetical protein [Pseudomonas aeruginosa]
MSNELTDVRCSCGDEYPADSYDAGFIAGSGMCQNCDAALTPKDICTCPSGDGSLRHPCPAHIGPFDKLVGSPVHNESEPDLPPLDEHLAQVFETGMALSESVEQAGGDERVIGWRERILAAHPNSDPGFWPDALLVEHMAAEIADLRAALAQPSPASDLDPLNLAPHVEAFNEAPAEALKPEQAEAERPGVVGYRSGTSGGIYADGYGLEKPEPLMTVAQHERIVGALRAEIAEWQEAAGRGRSDVVAYIAERAKLLEGRDAALARVAEMEAKLSDPTAVHQWQFSNAWFDGSEEVVLKAGKEGSPIRTLYTAPPAQAQQLHDLDKQCRDDVARALGLRPSQERGFAWSYLLASIKSCVKASEDAAQAQHSVPERLELTDDLKNILGRPNFTCTHLAQALRQIGFVIDRKAEAEQAACLHWMLNHYLANGANWKVHAEAELKAAAPGKEVGHE